MPRLEAWAARRDGMPALEQDRGQRVAITFGCDGRAWNEELVLQRYELLYEAGLIPEACAASPPGRASGKAARPRSAGHGPADDP